MRKMIYYFLFAFTLTSTICLPLIAATNGNDFKSIKEVRVTLLLENVTLEQALYRIEDLTDFRFVYSSNNVDKNQIVKFNAYDVTVANLLEELFRDRNLIIRQRNNQILIKGFRGTPKPKIVVEKAVFGAVLGKVTDEQTGEALIGATVYIKGTTIGSATDIDGNYFIINAPEGDQTLIVSFIGYKAKEVPVSVESKSITEVDVSLSPDVVITEEVLITAQALGQAGAINRQLSSNTIVNVVSKDRIDALPDQNAAESVGRLPGVAIQRDGGEGQKVVVRGLSPRFNNITFNGERIPSTDVGSRSDDRFVPDVEDRSVDLSFLSPDQLAGIEVFKAITPDMDGDAIGGTINFTARKAPEGSKVDVRVQNGYNNRVEEWGQWRTNGGASNRFLDNKLGVLVTGNYQRANRTSHVVENEFNTEGQFVTEGEVQRLGSRLIIDEKIRQRYGGSIAIDYQFSPTSYILLNSSVNEKFDDRLRRRRNMQILNDQVSYEILDQEERIRVYSNFLSGKHLLFGNRWEIDWQVSYSQSDVKTPYSHDLRFREESAFETTIVDPGVDPEVIDSLANKDVAGAFLRRGGARLREDEISEKIYTGRVDLKRSYNISSNWSGYVKFGAKYRFFDRDKDAIEFRDNGNGPEQGFLEMTRQFPDEFTRSTVQPSEYGMIDFVEPGGSLDFLDGSVDFGPVLSQTEANRLAALFSDQFYFRRDLIDNEDYQSDESITAGYAMTEINSQKFMFLGGLRLEYFNGDYVGFETAAGADDEDDVEAEVNIIERTNNIWYLEALPMFHARYKFTDWFDIRAAATRTLNRPSYQNLVPWRAVNAQENELRQGNPNLRHMTAWNYDIFLSAYSKWGLFTVGLFYKELENIDVQATQRIVNPVSNFNGFDTATPINVSDISKIQGVEIDAQVNFSSLPSPWNGIVLTANATFIETETFYPLFEDVGDTGTPFFNSQFINSEREGNIPGQPDFVTNASIGYEKGGFSGRFSVLAQDQVFNRLGRRADEDEFTQLLVRYDASVSQRLPKGFQVYANFNNIGNRNDVSDFFIFESFREDFGFTFDIGLRYTFEK